MMDSVWTRRGPGGRLFGESAAPGRPPHVRSRPPQVAAGRVVRDEALLSRLIGRHTVGAVERGEGWLCQDAGVVEFAAARGPAHDAMAAGPRGLEVFARDRGEAAERAGQVVFVAGRVDGDARWCVECVQGEIVENAGARRL